MILALSGLPMILLGLLAAVGIFLFARWLPRFLAQFGMTGETRLITVIAFVGLMIFGTLKFFWNLHEDSNPAEPTQANVVIDEPTGTPIQPAPTEMDAFVAQNYPNLNAYRSSLKQRLAELRTFFQEVKQWAEASPTQIKFLNDIINIRWSGFEALRATDKAVDLSLREFWIHYQTGQSRYVAKVFEEESSLLVDKIKDAQAFDNTSDQAEQAEIDRLLLAARKQLENTDIPRDLKNPRMERYFEPYTEKNRQFLLQWLQGKQEQTLISSLQILHDNQVKIEDSLRQIHNYLDDEANYELEKPMQEVIQRWQTVGRYTLYAQYQILYAVETQYLMEKLAKHAAHHPNAAVRQPSRAARDLYVRLQELAPQLARRAQTRRIEEVEQSYSPTLFLPTEKRR